MKKRGVGLIFLISGIIAAIVVSWILITNASGFGTGEFFYKIHLAEDLSWMVNALMASPGNAVVDYSINASEYILYFHDSKVEVYKPGKEMFKSEQSYVLNEKMRLNNKLEKPENIVFEKKENEISVR